MTTPTGAPLTDTELADKAAKCKLHVPEGRFFHGHVLVPTELLAQIIAALRRQPSSDQMLVPREPTEVQRHLAMMNDSPSYRTGSLTFYRTMLAAAEAEGK